MKIKKQVTTVELDSQEYATLDQAAEILEQVCCAFEGSCEGCPLSVLCSPNSDPAQIVRESILALRGEL